MNVPRQRQRKERLRVTGKGQQELQTSVAFNT